MATQSTKTIQIQRLFCFLLGIGMSFQLLGQAQEGMAAYYSDNLHGRTTSSGEPYNKFKFTAAHNSFSFGTWLLVTNLNNNKSVRVRVNDRGPSTKGRILDLSRAAAEQIDMIQSGAVRVRIEVISGFDTNPNSVASGRGSFSPAVSPRSRKTEVDLNKLPLVDITGNPIDQQPNPGSPAFDRDEAYVPGGLQQEPEERVGYVPSNQARPYTPSLFRMLAMREESVGYGVQIGAYFNFYRLMEGLNDLNTKGFQNTMVHNAIKDNKAVFRIIVGPYGTKAEADQIRRKLKNSKISGITVDLGMLR